MRLAKSGDNVKRIRDLSARQAKTQAESDAKSIEIARLASQEVELRECQQRLQRMVVLLSKGHSNLSPPELEELARLQRSARRCVDADGHGRSARRQRGDGGERTTAHERDRGRLVVHLAARVVRLRQADRARAGERSCGRARRRAAEEDPQGAQNDVAVRTELIIEQVGGGGGLFGAHVRPRAMRKC